jgi:hypothetical protein
MFELAILRALHPLEVAMRQRILNSLEEGGWREPGFLDLEICESPGWSISHDLIREVCGTDALAKLRARAAERSFKKLYVSVAIPFKLSWCLIATAFLREN